MQEGTRFDLLYDRMPWDQVDTVIFDIGNILIRYDAEEFVRVLFPGDEEKQKNMLDRVYHGKYWLCFDRGEMEYEEAARRLAEEYGGEEKDYLRALYGWFDLKTPIEEGFRTARLCKEKGKKILLLSNYPKQGFEFVTQEYAELFGIFDGGVISCYAHQLKPEREIYETILVRYGLEAQRTLFIDDLQGNIESAMRMGIHGFHMHESGMMDRFFL